MNETTQPLLLTADQVAGMLQVSPRTLWRLVSAQKVVGPVRIGGNTRWRRDEVEQWIGSGCPVLPSSENPRRR
jgi:excisionase family DNA binding protein